MFTVNDMKILDIGHEKNTIASYETQEEAMQVAGDLVNEYLATNQGYSHIITVKGSAKKPIKEFMVHGGKRFYLNRM